jgi:ribosomal protein S18 acetylase RimI-like enzyme
MVISIRQANAGDVGILAELNGVAQELHFTHVPQRFKPVDTAAASEWFRLMLGDPSVRAWIAESGGSPVGYVLAVTHDRPENPFCFRRLFCEIDQIAVSPGFRRKGLARALVDRALADARSRGIRDLELSSWSFNAGAHEAFRRLGFQPQIVRFSRTSC